MRPKKTRLVSCQSSERLFKPVCKSEEELQSVILTLDEFEALRMTHLDELEQTKIAEQMGIHQSTISRILACAHKKITDALVNVKAIKIEVGCCQIKEKNNEEE
jgi:uncharacterized protein